jgi:hypothetical protein
MLGPCLGDYGAVPDDLVRFGRQLPGRHEVQRELFWECYIRQVRVAFGVLGDWALAEEIALEAFRGLRRQVRVTRDPATAQAYLDRAVIRLARTSGKRPAAAGAAGSPPARPDDIERAWAELERRTREDSRTRRRRLAGCAGVGGAGLVLAAAVAAGPGRPGPPVPAAFPGAIVARIVTPAAAAMTADRGNLWVLTASRHLVRIDAATNEVTLREPVPGTSSATAQLAAQLAAGDGTLWVAANTTESARLSTQLLRISPADGRVLASINIDGCVSQNSVTNGPVITYGAGHLWIGCLIAGKTGYAAVILRVNPATDRVDGRTTPIRGPAGWLAAGSGGLWESGPMSPITQLDRRTMRSTGRTVSGPASGSLGGQPIVQAAGALWALRGGTVVEIGPASGLVRQVFQRYHDEPGGAVPAGEIAVSGDSLWVAGPPITRFNIATGRVLAQVAGPWDRGSSDLIAVTPGAVWVSTGTVIIRLDPGRIPPGPAAS